MDRIKHNFPVYTDKHDVEVCDIVSTILLIFSKYFPEKYFENIYNVESIEKFEEVLCKTIQDNIFVNNNNPMTDVILSLNYFVENNFNINRLGMCDSSFLTSDIHIADKCRILKLYLEAFSSFVYEYCSNLDEQYLYMYLIKNSVISGTIYNEGYSYKVKKKNGLFGETTYIPNHYDVFVLNEDTIKFLYSRITSNSYLQ